jgi:hypothetical protein
MVSENKGYGVREGVTVPALLCHAHRQARLDGESVHHPRGPAQKLWFMCTCTCVSSCQSKVCIKELHVKLGHRKG